MHSSERPKYNSVVVGDSVRTGREAVGQSGTLEALLPGIQMVNTLTCFRSLLIVSFIKMPSLTTLI